MTKDRDDVLVDDSDALEQLREMTGEDLGSEPLYDDEEKEKRVRHAFAKQKRALKSTMEKLDQVTKEKDKPVETPPEQPPVSVPTQSRLILGRLALRAMTNLGMTAISNEEDRALVDLEINRLYQEDVARMKLENDLATRADNLVNTELEKYRSKIGDEGVTELQKRLGKLGVTDRVNAENIRREVAIWVGEQNLSGDRVPETRPPPKPTQPSASEDGEHAGSAGRAVASQLKLGRPGVRPGDAPPPEKPATEDELATMRRLGFKDVKAFREAKVLSHTKDITT